jgi:hypothetical protein
MSSHSPQLTQWSDRLAFDTALLLEGSGETMEELLQRHNMPAENLLKFNKDTVFLKKVENYRAEVRDKGLTFKLKARAQAEELLTTSWVLIHDPSTSPAVKADLIKSTVKWAGLEPKGDTNEGAAAGGVRININFGGQSHQINVVDNETQQVESTHDTAIEYSE